MTDVARDACNVQCFACRRRNRRLRAFLRHEQQAVRMDIAATVHHSLDRSNAAATYADACTHTAPSDRSMQHQRL